MLIYSKPKILFHFPFLLVHQTSIRLGYVLLKVRVTSFTTGNMLSRLSHKYQRITANKIN
jgi:hypothetical protein